MLTRRLMADTFRQDLRLGHAPELSSTAALALPVVFLFGDRDELDGVGFMSSRASSLFSGAAGGEGSGQCKI